MAELNLFAVFPITDTYELPIGDNSFDFLRGLVTTADGTEVTMARRTVEDKPLKYLWVDVDSDVNITVRYLGEIQYRGRVASDGFYFQDLTYDEIILTTTVATNTQVIGSSAVIAGIAGAGAGGGGGAGGTGDVETVEADIDGKEAQTTNSLGYGRTSAGVTRPIDASPANTARTTATTVQATQHIDSTGKVQPAGDAIGNEVFTKIADGAGTVVDVETVEADIDTKQAVTANALAYGKVSTGVTVPVHVNAEGDVVTVSTPGEMIYGEAIPTASCAAGAAIEFDITSFSDLATLKQISITQLTSGTYDYTFEIWEKDGSGYTPGTYADHYLKIFSRDIDVREYNENIDQGLLYRDRDATTELHCRLVNNSGGTTSTFNVSIVAINSA